MGNTGEALLPICRLVAVSKQLFSLKFGTAPPQPDKAFEDCTTFASSGLLPQLHSTRRSYSKRHCDCEAFIQLKYITSVDECNSECLETFQIFGSAWYVWAMNDVHEGCIPYESLTLSQDEELIVSELLMHNHLACLSLAQSIDQINQSTGRHLPTPTAYV